MHMSSEVCGSAPEPLKQCHVDQLLRIELNGIHSHVDDQSHTYE
jgi:hypothetical protein